MTQKLPYIAQQYKRVAVCAFSYADVAAGGFFEGLNLPPGAIPTAGALNVLTAFDTGTTATVSVGPVGSPTANLAATTLKATGTTALSALPAVQTGESEGGITIALVGTPATKGYATVYIEYIQPGVSDWTQD